MLLEDFIITVYCVVDENLKKILKDKNIRKSGPSPSLTDSEVITMDIIGEYLSQKMIQLFGIISNSIGYIFSQR